MTAVQASFFGFVDPSFDPNPRTERIELAGDAWYEYVPNWLSGDLQVFDTLAETVEWRSEKRPMYDRIVDVPRLTASLPRRGPVPPVLADVSKWLGQTYGEPMRKIGLAWYRNGSDSVAPHGDQVARDLDTSVMATVSLGARRRFTLSPTESGTAASVSFELGSGDLLVMGGTVQRTWRHGVPKTSRSVGPRMCVMFRPPWLG